MEVKLNSKILSALIIVLLAQSCLCKEHYKLEEKEHHYRHNPAPIKDCKWCRD